jgi:DNA repair exonuclease SbcCD ATPase subunit
MLNHYLKSAVDDIKNLIVITLNDIDDIKEAKHEILFERNKTKEDILIAFENKKAMIDNEIIKLSEANGDKELEDILSEETKELLDELKNKLEELKDVNKRYARMVLSVGEFYNSMLEQVVPSGATYGNTQANGVYKARA